MNSLIFLTNVLLAGAAMISCAAQKQPEPSGQAIPARVTITASNHTTYVSATPVELKAVFGATPSFTLTIHGNAGGEAWSAVAMLDRAQALAGRATVQVASTPIGVGVANVTHAMSEDVREQASNGALQLTVSNGRISATVSATPSDLEAMLSGDTSISCWVARGALPTTQAGSTPVQAQQPQGTVGIGGVDDEPLVEDTELVTPPCSALRSWRSR
jgi:hypothetical protein